LKHPSNSFIKVMAGRSRGDFLSFQEIGDRMDFSSKVACKLWARAIVRLHRLLDIGGATGGR